MNMGDSFLCRLNIGTHSIFAVLVVVFGLFTTPAYAIPPLIAPAIETQSLDHQPAPVVRVYFITYDLQGPQAAFLVFRATSNRSAWFIQYAYCGGDPVNRTDTSGLDWEWIADTPIMGADDRPYQIGVKPGFWRFIEGSDPAVPMPTRSMQSMMSKGYPAPGNGKNGLPTIDMNYYVANRRPGWFSIQNGDFDVAYDRTPYLRSNGVYFAAMEGLTQYWNLDGMEPEQALAKFNEIDSIGVRASLVRGTASDTSAYLTENFWRYGGELAMHQLDAQAVESAWLTVGRVGVEEAGTALAAEVGMQGAKAIFAYARYARAMRGGPGLQLAYLEKHIKELGWDPARKAFNVREAAAGLRIETKLADRFGELSRSSGAGDFVASKTGQIIDHMGPGYGGGRQTWDAVRGSIDKHLRKQVDLVLIEMRGLDQTMMGNIRAYVQGLDEASRSRILLMDWP